MVRADACAKEAPGHAALADVGSAPALGAQHAHRHWMAGLSAGKDSELRAARGQAPGGRSADLPDRPPAARAASSARGMPKRPLPLRWDLAARDRTTMRRDLRRRAGTESRAAPNEPPPTT